MVTKRKWKDVRMENLFFSIYSVSQSNLIDPRSWILSLSLFVSLSLCLSLSLSLSLFVSLSFFFFYIIQKKIQVKNFCGIKGSSTSIGNQLKTVYMRFFQHEKTTTAMLESCTLANPFGKFNTGHFKGVEKVSMSNKRREVRNIRQLWTILFLLLTDL